MGPFCSSSSPIARPAIRDAILVFTSRRRRRRNGRPDPIEVLSTRLQAEGVADEAEIDEMRARAAKRFAEAVDRARAAPQPSIHDLGTDLFAEEATP